MQINVSFRTSYKFFSFFDLLRRWYVVELGEVRSSNEISRSRSARLSCGDERKLLDDSLFILRQRSLKDFLQNMCLDSLWEIIFSSGEREVRVWGEGDWIGVFGIQAPIFLLKMEFLG